MLDMHETKCGVQVCALRRLLWFCLWSWLGRGFGKFSERRFRGNVLMLFFLFSARTFFLPFPQPVALQEHASLAFGGHVS